MITGKIRAWIGGLHRQFAGHRHPGRAMDRLSYQQGLTYVDDTGPRGETQHCRSWQQGWQTFTDCGR